MTSLLATLGTTMTNEAQTLKSLAPPTFKGGPEFASKVITAFGTAGPAITAEAKKATANPSLATAIGGIDDSLASAVKPLEDLGNLQLTPATQAAIEALPACAKVKALGGG